MYCECQVINRTKLKILNSIISILSHKSANELFKFNHMDLNKVNNQNLNHCGNL